VNNLIPGSAHWYGKDADEMDICIPPTTIKSYFIANKESRLELGRMKCDGGEF
jgi:hypothetical protein